jgi:hypothetical protein
MITWVLGLTMTHLAIHLPQCHIVLMEQGSHKLFVPFISFFGLVHELIVLTFSYYPYIVHRLFSCGTNKEGESFLVEWNESEGAVKRTYHGLGKRSTGVVQFDTTKNRFLAAGDEFMVKFWDMDSTNLLTSFDADGGLLVFIGLASCFVF